MSTYVAAGLVVAALLAATDALQDVEEAEAAEDGEDGQDAVAGVAAGHDLVLVGAGWGLATTTTAGAGNDLFGGSSSRGEGNSQDGDDLGELHFDFGGWFARSWRSLGFGCGDCGLGI